MNKTIKVLAIAAVALTIGNTAVFAQKKIAEGKVVYTITPPDDIDPQIASMMPSESTVYFKNDKLKTTMNTSMMSNMTIMDNKTKKVMICMDIMGNKVMIKEDMDNLKKKAQGGDAKEPVVKVLDETKTIAGYVCKKAEVTSDNGDKSYVYFTSDIQANNGISGLKGIDGFMMEYDMKQNGMSMKMTAKSVSDEKVDENIFVAPTGYKETTMEDLKKSLGGR